jgi:hypothetical protein
MLLLFTKDRELDLHHQKNNLKLSIYKKLGDKERWSSIPRFKLPKRDREINLRFTNLRGRDFNVQVILTKVNFQG